MNNKLKVGTSCSGIGAPECAWTSIEGQPFEFVFNSEIESFPSAVLKHHYPNVPNLGDMTKYKEWPNYAIDVFVFGSPCQSFSIAGLRKGLDDPRGNLMLTGAAIAAKYRPRWLVWENVPGVLSSNDGKDFAAFLGLVTGTVVEVPREGWKNSGIVAGYKNAYGVAWRILDAQYAGVAQRRRRVFVVGHLGGQWQRAAAVLFERHSLSGDNPPSRKTRERIAPTISARTKGGGGLGTDFDLDGGCIAIQERACSENPNAGPEGKGYQSDTAYTLKARSQVQSVCPIGIGGSDLGFTLRAEGSHSVDKGDGGMNTTMVAEVTHSLRGEGFDASEDGTGRGVPLIPECAGTMKACAQSGGFSNSADHAAAGYMIPEAFRMTAFGEYSDDGTASGMKARDHKDATDLVVTPKATAYRTSGNCGVMEQGDKTAALTTATDPNANIVQHQSMAVRRLTPRECEFLQGFPKDYTRIPKPLMAKLKVEPDPDNEKHWAADGPRYKALGNSMAVPVLKWIGERILIVEAIK